VGSVGKELRICAPVSLGEHSAGRALGFARRAKLAAFEAVEQALGGEEAEAALISCDDAGGAVVDFDDVGVRLGFELELGHDCSFAEISAFLSWDLRGALLESDQQQQQAPVAAEKQRRVMPSCMSSGLRW
jgi:hypothetical protein